MNIKFLLRVLAQAILFVVLIPFKLCIIIMLIPIMVSSFICGCSTEFFDSVKQGFMNRLKQEIYWTKTGRI